jgi:hypothetical protein
MYAAALSSLQSSCFSACMLAAQYSTCITCLRVRTVFCFCKQSNGAGAGSGSGHTSFSPPKVAAQSIAASPTALFQGPNTFREVVRRRLLNDVLGAADGGDAWRVSYSLCS